MIFFNILSKNAATSRIRISRYPDITGHVFTAGLEAFKIILTWHILLGYEYNPSIVFMQAYMDSEIRAIMAQYMPLDSQGEVPNHVHGDRLDHMWKRLTSFHFKDLDAFTNEMVCWAL